MDLVAAFGVRCAKHYNTKAPVSYSKSLVLRMITYACITDLRAILNYMYVGLGYRTVGQTFRYNNKDRYYTGLVRSYLDWPDSPCSHDDSKLYKSSSSFKTRCNSQLRRNRSFPQLGWEVADMHLDGCHVRARIEQ